MRKQAFFTCSGVCAAAAVVFAMSAIAGPLDPPAGPVAPTNKTLEEIEPRIPIGPDTTPGDANSVFIISQPGNYYLTANITGQAGQSGITIIQNGVTIDLNGFELRGAPGSLHGIITAGAIPSIRISKGVARGWGGAGFNVFGAANAVIESVQAFDNGESGISTGPNATITNCVANDNGVVGIATGKNCVVTNSIAHRNTFDGFFLGAQTTISTCIAQENGRDGINTASSCRVESCIATLNGGDGIEADSGSYVAENSCVRNGEDPLVADGAGVRATFPGLRIEGNHVSGNDIGIITHSTGGSFVIKNSAKNNQVDDYMLLGVNTFGPIVTTTGEITTTNPWANFVF